MHLKQTSILPLDGVLQLIEEARNAELCRDVNSMQSARERVWDDFDRMPDFSLYDNRVKGELLRAAGGLRRLSFMLLTEVRFARKVRGLPFMMILCPSQRYHQEKGVRHRKLTNRARQAILLIQRWFSDYSLIFIGDSNKNYKD